MKFNDRDRENTFFLNTQQYDMLFFFRYLIASFPEGYPQWPQIQTSTGNIGRSELHVLFIHLDVVRFDEICFSVL